MLITSKARAWLHGALIAFVVGTAISIIAQQPVVFSSPQHVIVDTAPTTAVTGTFWQATQPVSGTFWQATQPVSGTFWQATQPISASSLPLPTGASTETTLGTRLADATFTGRMPAPASPADAESNTIATLSRIGVFHFLFNGTSWDRQRGDTTNGAFVQVKTSALPTGAATETTLGGVLTTSDFDTKTGSLTEAAPATDTASSGLNGRLQRIAQRLTTLLAVFPATLSLNTGSPDASTLRVIPADGVSECAIVSAASTNATNCKASAGNFVGLEVYNTTTTVYYLRLYNTVGAPTCSSATGFIRSIPVPPAAAAGQVGGAIVPIGPGVAYGTGVAFCLTGGSSSTDNTNAAVGIFGAIKYR